MSKTDETMKHDRPQVEAEEERPTKKQRLDDVEENHSHQKHNRQQKNEGAKKNGGGLGKNTKDAEKLKANRAITTALSRKDPEGATLALKDAVAKGFAVPTATFAGVLHQYDAAARYRDGVNAFETIMEPYLTRKVSTPAGAASVGGDDDDGGLDERVSTVLLRLQCHLVEDLATLKLRVERIAKSLHKAGTLKRRLFTEPLKQFAIKATGGRATPPPEGAPSDSTGVTPILAATQASLSLLATANKYDIELWDEDFLQVTTAVDEDYRRWRKQEGVQTTSTEWAEVMDQFEKEVLKTAMARYHPISGTLLANRLCCVLGAFKNLNALEQASNATDEVSLDQRMVTSCSSCQESMQKFSFENNDRLKLMRDIDERLVIPSIHRYVTTGSHRIGKAQKNKDQSDYATAMAAIKPEDMRSFNLFKENINAACLKPLPEGFEDVAIIDGANVGYYGVSGWYSTAKKEVLAAKGVNLATIPHREFDHATRRGKAMDVPLNFAAINAAAVAAVSAKWLPIIVLHERHLNGVMTPSNKAIFEGWSQESQARQRPLVVASPASMNDDFAWLYASVENNCKVITNDLMRDHHYGTLSRRTFLRWREQHRVPFKCGWPRVGSSIPLNSMSLRLASPPLFAVWIQQSTASSSVACGVAAAHRWDWHVPFYPNVAVLEQSTNDVKTEEEIDAAAAEQETVRWLCTK